LSRLPAHHHNKNGRLFFACIIREHVPMKIINLHIVVTVAAVVGCAPNASTGSDGEGEGEGEGYPNSYYIDSQDELEALTGVEDSAWLYVSGSVDDFAPLSWLTTVEGIEVANTQLTQLVLPPSLRANVLYVQNNDFLTSIEGRFTAKYQDGGLLSVTYNPLLQSVNLEVSSHLDQLQVYSNAALCELDINGLESINGLDLYDNPCVPAEVIRALESMESVE
jgi:hypothetical protein